jgi:glutamate carboxypeptidase
LFVSHLDTVYAPEEEARHGFVWREEDDRIEGPGVADIKGGTVLIWLALGALSSAAPELARSATWRVALNAAEEEGSPSFPPLLRSLVGPRTRACLVFECTRETQEGANTLTVARRGAGRFLIEVRGRAAHTGSGWARGASALREAARLVERIEAMSRPERGLTYTVGRLEAGTVVNTVPERARLWLDVRSESVEDHEDALRFVQALAGEGSVRARSDGHPCTIAVRTLAGYPPWMPNAGSERLAAHALEAGSRLGIVHELEHRHGASDGCHTWDLAPTLDGLGPAGAHIHCAEHDPAAGKQRESIRRSSLRERALLTALTVARVGASGDAR